MKPTARLPLSGSDSLAPHRPSDAGMGTAFAAGVRWLGVEDGTRVVEGSGDVAAARDRRRTIVLGSAHGPRLLDLLGACAC